MRIKRENKETSQVMFIKTTVLINLQQITTFAIILKCMQYKTKVKL